jgi:hypothetical protein
LVASATASAAPSSPRPWEGADVAPPPDEPVDPARAVGATRRRITTAADEPAIGANRELFERQYRGLVPMPLEVREARLAGGRRALAFVHASEEVRPFVVVTDAEGKALWHKERPLAGTHERFRWLTITAGPEGSVLVFWWDVTSKAVAGRRWEFDGSVFADFHLLDAEDCSGVDALYAPGRGWIVTATSGGRAEAAALTETGFRGFGDRDVDVSGGLEVLGPAAAAFGVDGVFFAFVGRTRAAAGKAAGPPHLRVTFAREDGTMPWKTPGDLGPVVDAKAGFAAPRLELVTPARARVTFAGRAREISSDGRAAADR